MIRFGVSGNSNSFYDEGFQSTEQAAKWLKARNLDAFEYSFGRGVRMTDKKAELIRDAFQKEQIFISAHAPYYINFANPDDEMAEKSYGYVLQTARMVQKMGGNRVVFHPATVGKMERQDAFRLTCERFKRLTELIYKENLQNIVFCPETMGKINQIGDLAEITELCKIDSIYLPTIDFGHLNARTHGGMKEKADYEAAIRYLYAELPKEKADVIHVHFSHISYSQGGEVKHLTGSDTVYGPFFEPLAEVFLEHRMSPVVLSEADGTQAEDAAEMKRIYFDLKESQK